MPIYENENIRIKLKKSNEQIIERVLNLDSMDYICLPPSGVNPYSKENLIVKKIKADFNDGVWSPKKIKIMHIDGRCLTTFTKVYI